MLSNYDKDTNKTGLVSNSNPLYPPGTPILVPAQSSVRSERETVPVVVPDVQELKEQFQQQQNMLTQLKETIKENESQLSVKEKKLEAYANRLSQIKARTKNNDGKSSTLLSSSSSSSSSSSTIESKPLTKKPYEENLGNVNEASEKDIAPHNRVKLSQKGKISELKKRLQESKMKFEERTDREVSETQKIESILENIKVKIDKRDNTIQELQKIVEQPLAARTDTAARRSKGKFEGRPYASKSTQTIKNFMSDESIEITSLQSKIHELETNILDLEENLKEKESVIDARTQAVTLLSQDMSMKGKNTLDCLEETRQEMRSMQSNFIVIESQLKKELLEKDDKLSSISEKFKALESANSELRVNNADLLDKLCEMEQKIRDLEVDRTSLKQTAFRNEKDDVTVELSNKVSSLHKQLDESNKLMIKMKLEHKNKIKSLNKTIEKLSENSDEKAEILRLQNKVDEFQVIRESLDNKIAELEEEKGNLLLSVLDVDDFKASEKKLKDDILELKNVIDKQAADIERYIQTVSDIEKEKYGLYQSNQDQNILIENLYAKIQSLESDVTLRDSEIVELRNKLGNMEGEFKNKLDTLQSEHKKEIEMLESSHAVKMASGDKREFEEYRISNELNNIQVEEQIELLVREKQQLLEKLKSLTGVSSTESVAFETVDNSEIQGQNELKSINEQSDIWCNIPSNESEINLPKVTDEQKILISDLQTALADEKEKAIQYQQTIEKLEQSIKNLEENNMLNKQASSVEDGSDTCKKQKANANITNKIKKMQAELVQSRKTVSEQKERLDELNMKLEEKDKLISSYIEKIESFERDDWGRENDWKSAQNDFEHVQELQKKCLSLENSLIELTEDCERLRKENIEVVHLLSEEKVKRKKLLENLQSGTCVDKLEEINITTDAKDGWAYMDDSMVVMSKSVELQNGVLSLPSLNFEERINRVIESAENLEMRLECLEMKLLEKLLERDTISGTDLNDLQNKLEWSNIVLTSMETDMFKLQNLLEDKSRHIEDLERDLCETREKLVEKDDKCNRVSEELINKEKQIEELSATNDKMRESVNIENQKSSSSESKLKMLTETIKQIEGDAAKKESQLKEIQGILAEKNLDIHNLRHWLDEVNNDLTNKYQERENMEKCLRNKEHEMDILLSEKNTLEEEKRKSASMLEDIRNQYEELISKNQTLENSLQDKDKIIDALNSKLSAAIEQKTMSVQDQSKAIQVEELKSKMKKLASNLKKKVQNEKDLLQQIKDHEEFLAEKERLIQKLQQDVYDVNEKWLVEQSEKEQFKNELESVISLKSASEVENADLREKIKIIETESYNQSQKAEYKLQQMETQLQKMYENSEQLKLKQDQDRNVICNLEQQLVEKSALLENAMASSAVVSEEIKMENEEFRKALAEMHGKHEELKFKFEESNQEKKQLFEKIKELKGKVDELESKLELLTNDNSCQQAKLLEQMAVIESLENDLSQSHEHLKRSEDKLCLLEERRSSLEMKNEEITKRMEEDAKNLLLMDNMSDQIRLLMESEQNLKATLKSSSDRNRELEQELSDITSDKMKVQKELNESKEKVNNLKVELDKLRDADAEKTETLEFLTKESEKLKTVKMENKQKSTDIEKLSKDIQLLEADLKENIENSKSVEKCLNSKIEELLKENAALLERNNILMETTQSRNDENKTPKRKKSVTFRTDETDYIRELKNKIQELSEALKKANEELDAVKMELMREKLRNEVASVVSEAEEKVESLKSTPEKTLAVEVNKETKEAQVEEPNMKFNAASFFTDAPASRPENFFDQQIDGFGLGNQENTDQVNTDFDSLMWDDGWGTDGHLEEQFLSTKSLTTDGTQEGEYREKIEHLESKLNVVQEEKQKLEEELHVLQGKYSKAIRKMKEQKAAQDKLQAEVNRLKSDVGFGGLDGAILDELKSQIQAYEVREKELVKNIQQSKLEKEGLLKRIDMLNAGNEKFVEMKERQDNEMEIWERKNRDLLKELTELRSQLENRDNNSTVSADENAFVSENRELKNKIEGLEWEICELKELLEEKQELLEMQKQDVSVTSPEKVDEEKSQLEKEIMELNESKLELQKKLEEEAKKNVDALDELQMQVSSLAAENETLQEILGEMKRKSEMDAKSQMQAESATSLPSTTAETKIFDYFKADSGNDVFLSAISQLETVVPVVEEVMQRKEVVPVQTVQSSENILGELEKLKHENEILKQELSDAQSVITTVTNERHEVAEKFRVEYEKAMSYNMDEKNSALQKVYELEQALAIKIEELNNSFTKLRDLDDENNAKTEALEAARAALHKAEQDLAQKVEEVNRLRNGYYQMDLMLTSASAERDSANLVINQLNEALTMKQDELNKALQTASDLEAELRSKLEAAAGSERELQQALALKTQETSDVLARLRALEEELNNRTASLHNLQKMNEELVTSQRNADQNGIAIAALNDSLNAEKSTCDELRRTITMKEDLQNHLQNEISCLTDSLRDAEKKAREAVTERVNQEMIANEYCEAKEKMEDLVSNLQTELETVRIELGLSREECEELRREREKVAADLDRIKSEESQELLHLRNLIQDKSETLEKLSADKADADAGHEEEISRLSNAMRALESHIEALKNELKEKDADIFELGQTLEQEEKQMMEIRGLIQVRDDEIAELKQSLAVFQDEINSFRNFEKQIKELRAAQIQQAGSMHVTAEGDPDFTNWTEHELAELNTKLQSDLDTALYILHQRDIRCDELTFELMQLLEERDTLQLRLSAAIRINEELRSLTSGDNVVHVHDTRQGSKDLMDQANDRQLSKMTKIPEENLQELARKISELHSVGYMKDKTIRDDTMQRHRDQMTLLGRTSDPDLTLGRESSSAPILVNWMRGKTTPKVIDI